MFKLSKLKSLKISIFSAFEYCKHYGKFNFEQLGVYFNSLPERVPEESLILVTHNIVAPPTAASTSGHVVYFVKNRFLSGTHLDIELQSHQTVKI